MKKIIFLLSCVLLIAVTSDAQQDSTAKKTKKERIQNHTENMDSTQKQKLKEKGITKENIKELDLSSDQRKQVDEIVVNTKKEKEKIKNDASLTDAQKEEKIKAIEKDSKSKMNNVLTPEQKAKMKKKHAKNKTE
jgi:Spy/CpxP family protein refolding chaperone